ncbi:S-methyl-5-thioribose-1-phosphate isomerase [Bdellovibrionota bacterium]
MKEKHSKGIEAIRWENGSLLLLDQRCLPDLEQFKSYQSADDVAVAIREMVVRGAPAIGITAAYGMVLAAEGSSFKEIKENLEKAASKLLASRPTAVNLQWGVERVLKKCRQLDGESVEKIKAKLEKEAIAIHEEDIQMNREIGRLGAELLPIDANVITHCNAGSLATGGYGTALGVIRSAFSLGRLKHVFVDETRPRLQGARLTAWELTKEKIPMTLIADNMAALMMATNNIDAVIVGADRIARNGDVANKIGTYGLAIAANYHHVPFYFAAPSSTFDLTISSGEEIVIEERDREEVLKIGGAEKLIAPEGIKVRNPSFDVTPASLISAIITEKGVHRPPFEFSSERFTL